jgi:hypothetical protein
VARLLFAGDACGNKSGVLGIYVVGNQSYQYRAGIAPISTLADPEECRVGNPQDSAVTLVEDYLETDYVSVEAGALLQICYQEKGDLLVE